MANIKSITKQLEELTDVIKSKKNFRVMPFPLTRSRSPSRCSAWRVPRWLPPTSAKIR